MILHVITNFEASSGAETMLARLLAHGGEEVLVVPLIGISDRNFTLSSNPKASFVPLGMRSPLAVPAATIRLARLIRKHRPDAILCWMYHAFVVGTVAARLAGSRAPVFWTVRQALDDPGALTGNTRLALRLARGLSRRCDGILYNSERAAAQHTAYGFDGSRVRVIPNGFVMPEPADIRPGPARVFGFAGRFHTQKDPETFFRAAAIAARAIPELHFVAAGKGMTADSPKVADLMAQAGLAPDRIRLLGELRDMDAFYRQVDALVLSSRTEGFPNVVAEAMSYGRPVVATDVGDAGAIVADTGPVVPPRDPEALAAGIMEIAGLPAAVYRDRAHAARTRIADAYALSRVAERFDAVLRNEVDA